MCSVFTFGNWRKFSDFFYCIVGSFYSVICLELILCGTYYTLVQRAYLIHCSLLNFCVVMFVANNFFCVVMFVANKNLGLSVYCILCSVMYIEFLICSVD